MAIKEGIWQALIERANVIRGQKALIHAGSSGVTTFVIQLARHLGGIVATTMITANVDLVTQLGADVVIDYTKDDLSRALRDYDGILAHFHLRSAGRGVARSVHTAWLVRTIIGLLSYRIRTKAKRGTRLVLLLRASRRQLAAITALIDDGIIRPVVDRVFPSASAREAIPYFESGRAKARSFSL